MIVGWRKIIENKPELPRFVYSFIDRDEKLHIYVMPTITTYTVTFT